MPTLQSFVLYLPRQRYHVCVSHSLVRCSCRMHLFAILPRPWSGNIELLTYCRVAAIQSEFRSLSMSEQDSTQCPITVESVPAQRHRPLASNACQDILPATQQEDTPHIGNTNMSSRTSVSALTQDRLESNNSHFDQSAALCQKISKAIDLQKAGLELNFVLPIHCYMPEKSHLDQYTQASTI